MIKKIKLFEDFNNNNIIYEANCPLNSPKIFKSSNESILFKILDINNDSNAKLIILKDLYNEEVKIALKKKKMVKKKEFQKIRKMKKKKVVNLIMIQLIILLKI